MAESFQANGMSASSESSEKDKWNVEESKTPPPESPAAEDKVKRDRQVMMRALSQGDALLWDNPIGWDVLVLCKLLSWRLHRSILSKCPYFTTRMIPWRIIPDDHREESLVFPWIQGRVRYYLLVLNNHDPGQIANVLRFLYFEDCPGIEPCLREPLYGDCLLTSTAIFIAGASVACQPMMDFVSGAIVRYATLVRTHLTPTVARDSPSIDYTVLRLAIPLRIALMMLYEQPPEVLDRHRQREDGIDTGSEERGRGRYRDRDRPRRSYEGYGVLWPLRRMLVRFTADVLPQLAVNPAFHAQFRTEWEGRVFLQQLEADMAMLLREAEAKAAGEGKSIARADTALSLLHELTRAEQALIAVVLRRQGQSQLDRVSEESEDEEREEREAREERDDLEELRELEEQPVLLEEEKEVARIMEQLDDVGLE